jgi:hypothetical protein
MRTLCCVCAALAIASSVSAAPNVVNVSQKGSALIFPDIRVDADPNFPALRWNTLIRISNDGIADVNIKCIWMDGNKNKVDFVFRATSNVPFWFDARTGSGTNQINPFPLFPSNGFDNPHLITPPAASEAADGSSPYFEGLLVCFVVDAGELNQVKWNHLSGTATLYHPRFGAYEYNAYAAFVPTGIDLEPVCGTAPPCIPTPGVLNLNGIEYDQCPLFQIAQFSPANPYTNPNPVPPLPASAIQVVSNRLAVAGCNLNLNQDFIPVFTKLEFEVWNEDERKFTGAFECADSWHETEFTAAPTPTSGGAIDAGAQNFQWATLQTYSARYRMRGVASTQCPQSQNVGLLGVQSSLKDLGVQATPIYDSIPAVLPPNVDSWSFAATSSSELGDHIRFTANSGRVLQTATVIMSSFTCQAGHWTGVPSLCATAPGATYSHPITLNLYQVNPGPTVGPLIASVTQNFNVPFRPSADITCPASDPGGVFPDTSVGIRWRSPVDLQCYNGFAFPITFNLQGVLVPDEVIWGISYAPTGNAQSLNQGTETFNPIIGTDVEPNGAFLNTAAPIYCNGGPTGTFRLDDHPLFPCWQDFRPLIRFNAIPRFNSVGTTLTNSGRINGRIVWDPSIVVPHGGIR